MYKIKFIPTGHVFILPESEAKRLKKQNPNEYLREKWQEIQR